MGNARLLCVMLILHDVFLAATKGTLYILQNATLVMEGVDGSDLSTIFVGM